MLPATMNAINLQPEQTSKSAGLKLDVIESDRQGDNQIWRFNKGEFEERRAEKLK